MRMPASRAAFALASLLLASTAAFVDARAAPETIEVSPAADPSQQKVRSATDATPPTVPHNVPISIQPGGSPAGLPVGTTPQPYLLSLRSADAARMGERLASDGIYFNLFDNAQYQAVTAGGTSHGSFGTNWFNFGVDLDLQKILGIPGASVHFLPTSLSGQGKTWDFNGSAWSGLNNWGVHDGLQLREFTWDQHLFGDRVLLLGGRTNPTGGEFDGSELYCLFASFICSSPKGFIADASGPAFTTSSWGGRLVVRPFRNSYVKLGIFEDEPWLRTANHQSWPGEDWGLNLSQGAFMPVEIGYRTNFATDRHPRTYSLGFTWDTAKYADPFYSTAGRPLATGGTADTHSGRGTVYFQAQQAVWRAPGTDLRAIIPFAAGNFSTAGYGVLRSNISAGLFIWGPFARRPRDYFGIVAENFLWNGRNVEAEDERLSRGQVQHQISGSETMLEINYGINFAPGMTFTPYAEYLWHPDQFSASTPKPDLNKAVEVGGLLAINLNQALGLPTLPRLRF